MAYVNGGLTYNTNSIQGWLNGIDEASIFDIDVRPKFAIGSGFKRADGNIYRYSNFIGAVGQGLLVSHIVADVDTKYSQPPVILGTSATQQGGDPIGTYPSRINSRYVLVTGAGAVKDMYAGGYFSVGRGTGAGYCYRIKGNTAAATVNAVANTVIIELYDQLAVALDASTYVSIIGSLYTDLIACTPGTNYMPIGVTQANMTANTFGWVCTSGVTQCLVDGTIAGGDVIQPSVATAGALQAAGVGTTSVAALIGQNFCGYCIDPAATTYYGVFHIELE